jgi:hypothetical protein
MSIRKTQRKNKTKQVISWPTHDEYFTIDSLVVGNPHMLTSSGSDITLRVRLKKAIDPKSEGGEEIVAVIGQKNCGKGRPQLVFAMRPIKQSVVTKAKADGINIDTPKIMPIMEISPQTIVTPVTNIATPNRVTA